MLNILAIETSSDACSLSLQYQDRTYTFHEVIPRRHTERLLIEIKKLLQEAGARLSDLDAIGVGCGPGSFTGIRLACSVAQGLAFSNDLKTIQVSSLEVLAHKIHSQFKPDQVISIVDARMNQLYLGKFSYHHSGRMDSHLSVVKIEDFTCEGLAQDVHFVGDGCGLVLEKIDRVSSKIHNNLPNAENLLGICLEKYEKGDVLEPEKLLPIYLSSEDQWKKI